MLTLRCSWVPVCGESTRSGGGTPNRQDTAPGWPGPNVLATVVLAPLPGRRRAIRAPRYRSLSIGLPSPRLEAALRLFPAGGRASGLAVRARRARGHGRPAAGAAGG